LGERIANVLRLNRYFSHAITFIGNLAGRAVRDGPS
jgi:hypothetical protein